MRLKGKGGVRFLLDTSALLAHSRQEPGWSRVQMLFEEGDSEVLAASAAAACERGACLVHRDHHMEPIPASVVEQIDLSKESDP